MKHMPVNVIYLFECVQCFCVDFSNKVSLCNSIEILPNWINVYQAIVSDFNSFEVREEPANNFKNIFTELMSGSFHQSYKVK